MRKEKTRLFFCLLPELPDKFSDGFVSLNSTALSSLSVNATITLGNDAAIVFLPGEVFVELGLAIKQGSPYRTTLIVELSNCVETMYIPTRAAYAGGSYEVINSALKPGSGEMLVEAALRQLRDSASAGNSK